ncbi:beta family protein [Pluralibacter gergoviae]|uniref:beta family protein n=1 Tax=Pluralibacter gergoviae TaxID=61647 RepID=UPI00092E7E0F|nr:hypothetical protein [Pluralibacter gergoviae]MCK1067005.1 beta family protein [Pluralibacter gergoviae]MCV7757235.1 beta family protein [Pluralibacter gergoviae]PHH45354.1 hypothetical protein CRX51_06070 [Pluralibacter gergoviae]HDS1238610.1 hypothetical protein [Pluralibacter gergoviae]HDS1244183.1 hypothetical protein [Pluralibacter gergoviae]
MSTKYYPIIKTTIAEMRAMKNINTSTWEKMVPILELTKSRKGKNNPDSSVYKKIEEICQVVKSEKIILDITTIDTLSNSEIESFRDDQNGFENWCNFIGYTKTKLPNVIPVLLAYPDSQLSELLLQIENLSKHTQHIAIRLPIFEDGLGGLFANLIQLIQHRPYLINSIIFDSSYIFERIEEKPFKYIIDFISYFYSQINGFYQGKYIFCSEHYPANITDYLKKNQDQFNNVVYYGNTELYKNVTLALTKSNINNILLYGDYACIHPFRNDVKSYNWIPRIDYPTESLIYFSKVRRDVGGYEQCANNIVRLPEFQRDQLKCWGMEEIMKAALIKPGGLNPSYWISVRANIHMSRIAETFI